MIQFGGLIYYINCIPRNKLSLYLLNSTHKVDCNLRAKSGLILINRCNANALQIVVYSSGIILRWVLSIVHWFKH